MRYAATRTVGRAQSGMVSCALLAAALFGMLGTPGIARGQRLTPPSIGAPVPAVDNTPLADDADLRRQIGEMSRRLQDQQVQLRQQAIHVQEFERRLQGPTASESRSATTAQPGEWLEATAEPAAPNADPALLTPLVGQEQECECYPRFLIGGQYRLMFNASNFDFHAASITDHQQSETFFNQRFRTWLTVQTSENVEAYVQAQMGHIGWGENFDFSKSFVGPRFPAADDRVGVLMRYGYLSYHNDTLGRLQAGIQGWQDSFGQTLASSDWDFSVGGLSWERQFPNLGDTRMLFGMFELVRGDVHLADKSLLLTLDLDRPVLDEHSVGFSVYFLPDSGGYSYPSPTFAPYRSAWDVWLGARFRLALPVVPLNGFAIYNTGAREDVGAVPTFRHDGAALKLEAGPIPIGPGKVSVQTLYATGGDNPGGGFRTVAQGTRDNFGAQGYWSYLMLTTPHGPSDVNDLGVSLQNRGFGLLTFQTKYDYPISKRLSGCLAVGWLRSDAPNPANGSTDMGTELGNNFTLDFGGGLKADMGVSVLFTGGFYKPSAADSSSNTLYEAFTRVQLEF